MTAVKVATILGTSAESWEAAAHEAFHEASETIENIHRIEVEDWTASVDDGEITTYEATVEVTFLVHQSRGYSSRRRPLGTCERSSP
ncbi:dodecin family protein [Haloarcula onubensis]|uniref:Dodecin family protein n=1 Tax=Haloarcula onubensis TaxID=2950539 RepID=A0ABU2FM67_9EURY|nr:dodecin family protein [Halomicroarcula sp. S3CR25-11]MDS0281271.1 dodecin family protein [Halomicroarcula sp. S3CR25-11]